VTRLGVVPLAIAGAIALALAGCGLAVGSAPTGVQLLVTRGFGQVVVQRTTGLHASEGETVRSLLAANRALPSGSPGAPVTSVDGLSEGAAAAEADRVGAGKAAADQAAADQAAPDQTAPDQAARWVYYVNGVQALKGPAHTEVHPGDHVWWDLHDASQAPATPAAIVGAFPQPFLNGIGGKRLPVRVECTAVSYACGEVTATLRRFDVPAAITAVGSGGAPETLRVMVGPWKRIGGDLEAQSIARGPRASGVYARFSADGGQLTLLDAEGQPARTLGGGAGLVAATQAPKEAPVWVVTGTDEAGVALAARAFNRATLEDRFAVALQAGVATPLPVPAASVR
jgi:hypothetical protein